MQGIDEREAHGWMIRIDRTLCVGFGDCVEAAPDAFDLDLEGVAIFLDPGAVDAARLREACGVCPVDALVIFDMEGQQIVP